LKRDGLALVLRADGGSPQQIAAASLKPEQIQDSGRWRLVLRSKLLRPH